MSRFSYRMRKGAAVFHDSPDYDHAIGGGIVGSGLGGITGWLAAKALYGNKATAGQKALGILLGALGGGAVGGAAGYHIGRSIMDVNNKGLKQMSNQLYNYADYNSKAEASKEAKRLQFTAKLHNVLTDMKQRTRSIEDTANKALENSDYNARSFEALNNEFGDMYQQYQGDRQQLLDSGTIGG